ncbi:hypothetical protein [Neorhizobium huautlense]|uniref:hypothetical protein n=1 Tax=Neorhizobium huautlense TaxID=67774 RepID=UPI000CF8ECC2|nr:hypothetical protein [Neorhizobium huautlense]
MTDELDYRNFAKTFSGEIEWVNDFLLNQPLYNATDVGRDARGAAVLYQVDQGELNFDCHCAECGKHSVFRRESGDQFTDYIKYSPFARIQGGQTDIIKELTTSHHLLTVVMICQRNKTHALIFIVSFEGGRIQKVGQLPSLEDIAGADIERFRKILGKGYFQELRRAGGLASHGIGIGAFVYLRRIFEMLIWEHYSEHKKEKGDIEGFETLRMDEKIAALANVLPKTLVANKAIYSILSKGIHALSEEECRDYFPIVRSGVIAILEQDLAEKEKMEADKRLAAEVARLAGKLKG